MYRVTTPSNTFKMPDDVSNYEVVQITYREGKVAIVKEYRNGVSDSGMSISGKDIVITLTQEETKKFNEGVVKAQVRAKTPGSKVMASKKFNVNINDVLNEEIL